jgi:hypothetical protein
MAIGRITGQMLSANLARSGTDLTFETNLLALDVTNSRVGVGTASPATTLHISATDAIRLPSGSSAQRPGSPANGDIRYNSDTGAVEGYASGWLKMTGGTSLADADADTQIEVERTSDEDQIHFQVAGTDAAHIRADGQIELNNLNINDLTISSLTTNGDINITPNGTGQTVIKNLSVTDGLDLGDLNALNVGDINVDSVSSDNGTDFDLTLDDNSATALEIKEGANAYMTFDTTNTAEVITASKAFTVASGVTFTTDTADINGGAIDGTTIGANSAAAGTFTNLTANGEINIDGDGSGDNIDGVIIGANTAAAGTFTNLTANGTIDIDSTGNMDGIIIGANTAAAGTFTTANATTVVSTNVQATNYKANDGTAAMTIADTTGDVNVSTNFSVDGNLTVNGTTTTVDSQTLTIEDPLLTLAKNNSGGAANTFDQGLFFNRGSDDNVSFLWDESTDQFAFAVTASEDGTTAGNVTIDSYAALRAGVITATDVETGSISAADGTESATIANSTGIMTIPSSVLTTTDINGGTVDGVTIGGASAGAGTFTNLTVNTNVDITDSGGDGTIDGVIIGANTAAAGTFTALSGTSLSVGDGNITNVGDIALDSISADGTTIGITLTDNTAAALDIKEGANSYLKFDTTDSSELITASKAFTVASGVTFTTDTADINGGAIDGTTIGANSAAAGTFTTATATSVNATNYRANDGTAAIVITDSTGAVAVSTALTATGNVSVDGGTFTFNDTGADLDFRFEGDNDANLLFGDAGNDRIGIGTNTPNYVLDMGSSTDALKLPEGNTAARPTAATGIIRFNTETGKYEGSTDGSTYVDFATAGDTPNFTKETTTGDGSTTTFSGFFSTAPASANNVFVYIDNVYQEPTENYTVSGTNITFTSAPHSGARIFAITGADNSALVTGGVARSETTAVSVSGSSATNIMTFNAATYRSAELFITVQDSGNTQYSAMKATVIHDGTTAYGSTYAVTNTAAGDIVDITFNHDGSNTVEIKATPLNSGTQSIKVQYSLLA